MGHKHLLKGLFASASLAFAAAPAFAAPPIAYSFASNNGNQDLYLINPDGSGKTLLYSAGKVNMGIVDMDPSANRLALVQSNFSGFKVIDYSATGVRTNVTSVPDSCQVKGLDFHRTDGSLLVSELCTAQGNSQIRRWTQSGFDTQPLATFGSVQVEGVGHVRWLGDGSGFLVGFLHDNGTTVSRRIDRYMLNALSSPVTVIELSTNPFFDFDTARCTGSSTGPCWALMYDDGTGKIHKLHFDSMGATEEWVKAGETPHFSPNNSQTLYRLQVRPNMLLKVDNFSVVSKGNVAQGIDWRP